MSKGRKYAIAAMIIPLVVMFAWWRISSHSEHQADKMAASAVTAGPQSDPFTKVIAQVEVPPGGENGKLVWSDKIVLPDPDGPQFRARLAAFVAVKVYGPDGNELIDRAIKDSREDQVNFYGLPKGSTAKFASLVPGQGGTLRFLVKE